MVNGTGTVAVLQLIHHLRHLGMRLIIDEGRSTLNRGQMPEELSHRIIVGRKLEGRTGQMKLTDRTEAMLRGR